MIGRYLDLLARHGFWDAIDRVIEAQKLATGRVIQDNGDRCLVGHAEDWRGSLGLGLTNDERIVQLRCATLDSEYKTGNYSARTVAKTFDRLCFRFGRERVVRLIKQRAGKHTRPNVEPAATLIDSAVKLEHATT